MTDLDLLGKNAKKAAAALAALKESAVNAALELSASALKERADELKKANDADIKAAREKGLSPAFATKVEHGRIYGFFRDYKSEMKKIVWSSKEDVLKNTVVVVVTLVIVGALVGLLDLGFSQLLLLIGKIGA